MNVKNTLSLLLTLLFITACVPANQSGAGLPPTSTPAPPPTANPTASPLQRYYVPTYYSNFYIDIVEGSQFENKLIIYSPLPTEQWASIVEAFNDHYPWIVVETSQLSDEQVIQIYQGHRNSGQPTADLIVSSDMLGWFNMIDEGEILTYASPEAAFLPEWSRPAVGIYTLSSDPMVLIFNKINFPEKLIGLQDLSDRIDAAPGYLRQRVILLNPASDPLAFSANWFFSESANLDEWLLLSEIGSSAPLLYDRENTTVEEIGRGTAYAAYFVPTNDIYPRLTTYPFIDIAFLPEGQPILARHIAITQGASHPNAAKLMLDFILSQEGQMVMSFNGLTPYRSDIRQVTNYHLDNVAESIGGPRNLIFVSLDRDMLDPVARADFLARWEAALQGQ